MALQFSFVALTRANSGEEERERSLYDTTGRHLDRLNWIKCCHQAGLLENNRFTGRFTTSDADLAFKKAKGNADAEALTFDQFVKALEVVAHIKGIKYDVVEAKVNKAMRGGKIEMGVGSVSQRNMQGPRDSSPTRTSNGEAHGGGAALRMGGRQAGGSRTMGDLMPQPPSAARPNTPPPGPGIILRQDGDGSTKLPELTSPSKGFQRINGHQMATPFSPQGSLSPAQSISPFATPPASPPPGERHGSALVPSPRASPTVSRQLFTDDAAAPGGGDATPLMQQHRNFRTHHVADPAAGAGPMAELGARFTRNPNTVPDRSPSGPAAGILAAEPPPSPPTSRSPRASAPSGGRVSARTGGAAASDAPRNFNANMISFKVNLEDAEVEYSDDPQSDASSDSDSECDGGAPGGRPLRVASHGTGSQKSRSSGRRSNNGAGSGRGLAVESSVDFCPLPAAPAVPVPTPEEAAAAEVEAEANIREARRMESARQELLAEDLGMGRPPLAYARNGSSRGPSRGTSLSGAGASSGFMRPRGASLSGAGGSNASLSGPGSTSMRSRGSSMSGLPAVERSSSMNGSRRAAPPGSSMNGLVRDSGALTSIPEPPPGVKPRDSNGSGKPKSLHRTQPPLQPSLGRTSMDGHGRPPLLHSPSLEMQSRAPQAPPASGWSTAMGWQPSSKNMMGQIVPPGMAPKSKRTSASSGQGRRAALGLYAKKCDAARGFSEAAVDSILGDGDDGDDGVDDGGLAMIRAGV